MTALGTGNCGKAEDGGFLSSSHCNLTSFEIITGRNLKLENPEQIPGEQREMSLKVLCVGQPVSEEDRVTLCSPLLHTAPPHILINLQTLNQPCCA